MPVSAIAGKESVAYLTTKGSFAEADLTEIKYASLTYPETVNLGDTSVANDLGLITRIELLGDNQCTASGPWYITDTEYMGIDELLGGAPWGRRLLRIGKAGPDADMPYVQFEVLINSYSTNLGVNAPNTYNLSMMGTGEVTPGTF